MNKQLRFQKGDILAVVMVILLAVVVFLCFLKPQSAPATVEVYQDGNLVKTLPLEADQTFIVEGNYTNTVTVQDGKVAITQSNCPGEDCVHSGWVRSVGRSIVCLPNAVEVRVTGRAGDVDFVVG